MSDARWAALLFAAAFLARLLAYLGSAIFGTDSCHFLLMADWMRVGRFHDALLLAYHPLYPLMIAAGSMITATTEQAGSFLSILLGSAGVFPLYSLALAVFNRPVAVLTTLLYGFAPAIVEVQSDVMTEGVFMFFLFSSAWMTRRMMDEPSALRGAVLGGAAAGAFLTRPEGLLAIALAVAWPIIELVRRRSSAWPRVVGVAASIVVILLLLSPYLLWVKSVRGQWGLSIKPSAIAAERAVGVKDAPQEEGSVPGEPRLYKIYAVSLFRLSLYGALIPFFILGAARLKEFRVGNLLFYLSYPLGLLGGVLFILRTHTFMSERYLLAGFALLSAVAAHGMVVALRAAARRWPDSKLRPAVAGALLLLLLVAPSGKYLKPRRQELLSYPVAAQWILDHGPRPKAVVGLEQVAYYCGSRSYYGPDERQPLLKMLDRHPTDYIVYSDKDVRNRPEYVAMLRSLDRLEPAVEIEGPPRTWKVYIHRVK